MSKIEWVTTNIKISDLIDYPHNPRSISKKDYERLVNDIKQDGYHRRLLVNYDNVIVGGHSRKKALLDAGYSQNQEIEVLKSGRLLSTLELQRLNIRDNLPFGDFDFDILGNHFDAEALIEFGMPPEWLDLKFDNEAEIENDRTKCELCGK